LFGLLSNFKPANDHGAIIGVAQVAHSFARILDPIFAAAVDAGIPDAYDDPQNFDLARRTVRLGMLLKAMSPSAVHSSP